MALAFTFPGQGSQAVGMGKDLADASPEARAVFAEVDDALGEKLSAIMWEGPEDTLTLTANAQPALMAVSMAAMRALETRGFVLKDKVSYVAGHSLGEYSALCAAGMFSVGDCARLLRIRGNAMQAAVPVGEGAMAAIIGLDDDAINKVCADTAAATGQVVAAVNFNSPGQVVIAGHSSAVEAAIDALKEAGAKRAMPLPVSAPFHTELMRPAGERLAEAMADIRFAAPEVPVVHNVNAATESEPERIRALLVEQIYSPVQWTGCVAAIAAAGVVDIVECGPGKVLSGLNRRIDKTLRSHSLEQPDELASTLQALT